jgi:hypothetical protein
MAPLWDLRLPRAQASKGRCLAAEAERFRLGGTCLPAGRLHPQCLYCSTVPQSETIATLALALVASRVGSGFDLGCHRHPEPLLFTPGTLCVGLEERLTHVGCSR